MDVPCGTEARLRHVEAAVLDENQRQNLIAASTVDQIRRRHTEDSLQLLPLMNDTGPLLDIGSGAGFPGLALACVTDRPIHLVEPRRRRAEFLARVATELSLDHVTVHRCRVETVRLSSVDTITARAVASLDRLLAMSIHLATSDTRWVLLKGRTANSELEAARATWHGRFELFPSRTDTDASIIVATEVKRRRHA